MALKLPLDPVQTKVGVAAPEAYIRIDNLAIFNFKTTAKQVRLNLEVFFDAAARTAGANPILRDLQTFTLTADEKEGFNLAQAYAKLKTVPFYKDAGDC